MKVTQGNKYEEITEALKKTNGFCPCVAPYNWKNEDGSDNDDWKCMCKQFIEQNHVGECHCGRFMKTEVE